MPKMKAFIISVGIVFLGAVYLLNYIQRQTKKKYGPKDPRLEGRKLIVFLLILFFMGVLAIAKFVKP